MRRLFVVVLIALSVVAPARALAGGPVDQSGSGDANAPTTTIDNSFLDTDRNITDCVNNSVQLPDCGRAPTQEGDRGGALQLATFAILTLGIAFICWRVVKGVRARDTALAAQIR